MQWLRQFFSVRAPRSERWFTLANCLTTIRIMLVPFIVASVYERDWEQATFLFACAALTDLLDGMVARWRSEITLLGACLDPLADKLLVVSSLGALAVTPSPIGKVPGWFFSLVLAKEVALLAGIGGLLCLGSKLELAPTGLSKWATTLQMVFLFLIMWCIRMHWVLPAGLYSVLLSAATLATCASLAQYSYIGFRVLIKSALRGGL